MINSVFSPLAGLNPLIAILVVSALVSTIVNLCYKFLMDQNKAREIKTRSKELQARLKELQKNNDIEGMNKIMSEAMKNNSEQMGLMLKPMIVSMLIAALTLPWLHQNFSNLSVNLPASVPYIGSVVPFGWIGWYLLCSIPFILITRKLFGLEL